MPQLPSTAIGSLESQKAHRKAEAFAFSQARTLADKAPLYMRRAKPDDFGIIEHMINDAKKRLRDLGTDQWSDDEWPDNAGRGRMARVRYSIEKRNTWIAELRIPLDAGVLMVPVATVTIERKGSTVVWNECERKMYPAVYLSRLVVATGFISFDIGASIIDWAGRRGSKQRNAASIRIDVWTTNTALHDYYLKRGFQDRGSVTDESYPAGRRFERPTAYDSGLKRPVLDGDRRQTMNGAMFTSVRWARPVNRESLVSQPSFGESLIDA
jgi:hypothetical protein